MKTKTKTNKIFKTVTAISLMGAFAAPNALAQFRPLPDSAEAPSVCEVAVCDIEMVIETLREANEADRFAYATELIKMHSASSDVAVLKNLLEVSKRMEALFVELGDADWVIREAQALGNHALLGLVKHSEIEAKAIIKYFSQLASEAKRYEAISFYTDRLSQIESTEELAEIIKFAAEAREISMNMGDDAYVARAADTLSSQATIKIVALDPVHEGVYKITSSTKDEHVLDIDKIVVLDSSSHKNLVVNFINSKFNRVVFSYSEAVINGNKITGKSVNSSAMSSQFELVFDRDSGAVEGMIQTTRTNEIVFKAQRAFTVRDVFKGEAPVEITDKDILGTMEGSIMGINGTLSVHSFIPGVYSASFISERGELKIDYQGKFFPKKGVLSLTHENKSKLVIALRKVDDEAIWTGASFSVTNGKASKAMFNPLYDLNL